MNFWQEILTDKEMILALAPMDGITDYPFRSIVKKYGKPDVIFTEFANVEGICHGASQILKQFDFDDSQRPIVAQIFGKNLDHFYQLAILLSELGVEGIDINMGCPARTVANNGSGAALIRNPDLAIKIIKVVRKGINDWGRGKNLDDCQDISEAVKEEFLKRKKYFSLKTKGRRNKPALSIKTRIGFEENEIKTWLPYLLAENPDAITLHGRSLRQAYTGKADWEVIAEASKMVRSHNPEMVFLGNGDVKDYNDALVKVRKYGVDGVLIGRASFGNPFVFLEKNSGKKNNIFKLALEHAIIFEETYQHQDRYRFLPMRKHLAWYTKGIEGAAKIRAELVRTNSSKEVKEIFDKHNLL